MRALWVGAFLAALGGLLSSPGAVAGADNQASPYPEGEISWDAYSQSVDIFNQAHLLHSTNPQKAAALYRKATSLNPYLGEAWINLGILLVSLLSTPVANAAALCSTLFRRDYLPVSRATPKIRICPSAVRTRVLLVGAP